MSIPPIFQMFKAFISLQGEQNNKNICGYISRKHHSALLQETLCVLLTARAISTFTQAEQFLRANQLLLNEDLLFSVSQSFWWRDLINFILLPLIVISKFNFTHIINSIKHLLKMYNSQSESVCSVWKSSFLIQYLGKWKIFSPS